MELPKKIMKLAILSSVRRRLIYYFNKDYIKKMLLQRKGSCDGCLGKCCIKTRPFCTNLKDGKCLAYDKNMPVFCKIFPIDNLDIKLAGMEGVCLYSFLEPIKFPLQNGLCAVRHNCNNVNTKNCDVVPKGKDYVECMYYEMKGVDNEN